MTFDGRAVELVTIAIRPTMIGSVLAETIGGAMLIFVVARTRLDRYDELRRQLEDWRDVRIVLDRREGERRVRHGAFANTDRRRTERRRAALDSDAFAKLGWSVIDTDDRVPGGR